MCQFLPLKDLFFAIAIATWQSQCMGIEGVGLIPKGISVKKFLSQSTSFPADSKAINSDSIVDLAIIFCLADF